MNIIELNNLQYYRSNDYKLTVKHLAIEKNSKVLLFGPSGSGKTTLLRLITGLEKPNEGVITLDGCIVEGYNNTMPPHERGVSFLGQEHGLWQHLTALQHMAFTRTNGASLKATQEDTDMLELVRIKNKSNELPCNLSFGEQQRVALARALINRPKILLLDEPFSNIDVVLTRQLMSIIENLQQQWSMTIVQATHFIQDVESYADKILILQDGEISDYGTWADIKTNPSNDWAACLTEVLG